MSDCHTVRISRGSDWTVTLAFKDAADAAIDYTGASLGAELISNVDDSLVATPGTVWDDPSAGQASLSLTESETPGVPAGTLCRLRITTVTATGTTKIWPTALVEGV